MGEYVYCSLFFQQLHIYNELNTFLNMLSIVLDTH